MLIQVLITTQTHLYWESMMSEADSNVAILVLENLIKYTTTLTQNDIRNEFAKFPDKYLVIMENWFSSRKFTENLKKFNDRKDYIKILPLNEFIEEYSPKLYLKWYNTELKNHRLSVRKLIEELHPNLDVTGLVNLGPDDDIISQFTWVFSYILREYGFPSIYRIF